MIEQMLKDHTLRMELNLIAELESSGGTNPLPKNPDEQSFGRYHLNTISLIDAGLNGIPLPDEIMNPLKESVD